MTCHVFVQDIFSSSGQCSRYADAAVANSGLVVSALGMRTRRLRFESRVVPLFHWVATSLSLSFPVGGRVTAPIRSR